MHKPVVRSIRLYFVLEYRNVGDREMSLYFIQKRDCDTYDKLMRCLVALCRKPWVTARHLVEFSRLAADELGFSADPEPI